MIRLYHDLKATCRGVARPSRPVALGAVALTAVVAVTGCGSSPAGSPGSGTSQNSGTSQSSAFRQCLEKHGVNLPSGHLPGGGGGGNGGTTAPHPRPSGSAASAFRQAIQACGGSGFGGNPGAGG